MSDKDEALRLAEQLKERFGGTVPTSQAAACLRRQHAEIERLYAQRFSAVEDYEKAPDWSLLEATQGALREHMAEIHKLRAENDALRMQLVACGVVALANTPESATNAREMHPDYRSASCDDVARAVDREMALRAERDALHAEIEALKAERDEDRRREYGYSQQTVDALTKERDALRAALKQAVARQGFTNDELISARALIANATGENK